ncbi:hypothetical protein A2U01_0109031, partial [Trifolium medium]|nr:hypothetical protein [Trifolium medium]
SGTCAWRRGIWRVALFYQTDQDFSLPVARRAE